MRKTFLPFSPPLIGEEEINEVVDTLRSNWLTTGPKTRQFETDFANFLSAPGALALNSCTAGLHTALVTLGIGPGDEVITTPMTFAASVNVIEHVGARPVFADVEPDTLNISPEKIEAAITPKTKAIIPVHYSGHPVKLDQIQSIAEENNLLIIEDAAHAIPASINGTKIGASGNPTAFSFYATKNLTTGEGGMLTGDPGFLDECRIVSLHGMSREAWNRYGKKGTWKYDVVRPGFKYNMTDIQAAIGIWQLKKLPDFQNRRAEIVSAYQQAFKNMDHFQLPVTLKNVEHAHHLYPLRILPNQLNIDRDQFIEELRERQIGTSVHFIPMHLHSYYQDKYQYQPIDFPVAFEQYQQLLSLPLNPKMTDEDVSDVIQSVEDIISKHKIRRAVA
jgi:dTDP-4-amino-4,6-dideoxygalactose transaminase